MLRVNEFFYEEDTPEFVIETSAFQQIRDPKLFTFTPPSNPPKPAPKDENKNKPVVMRVSICCSSCVDMMAADFGKVTGFKNAEYDIHRQKVTVTGTASLADVLSAARRHFKDAELWE